MEINENNINVMDDARNNIIEGSGDILEYGIDFFTENEAVKDFPILGTVIKIGFTVKSISDRIFLKKIERFLFQYQKTTNEQRKELSTKITLDTATRKKVGEALILLLDRFSDFQKPEYLAKCFYAYLGGRISLDNFIRLGNAIDVCHSPDLRIFILHPQNESNNERLLRSGLTEVSRSGVGINIGQFTSLNLQIAISVLGKMFVDTCAD